MDSDGQVVGMMDAKVAGSLRQAVAFHFAALVEMSGSSAKQVNRIGFQAIAVSSWTVTTDSQVRGAKLIPVICF